MVLEWWQLGVLAVFGLAWAGWADATHARVSELKKRIEALESRLE